MCTIVQNYTKIKLVFLTSVLSFHFFQNINHIGNSHCYCGIFQLTCANIRFLTFDNSSQVLQAEFTNYVCKRSLGQGNVSIPVCQSFCSRGVSTPLHARIHIPQGRHLPGRPPLHPPTPWADTPPPRILWDTVNKQAECTFITKLIHEIVL